jgi:hypothetical protein
MNSDADRAVEDPFAIDALVVQSETPLLPADIERYFEAARVADLARKGAGAAATLRAYRADWGVFTRWCRVRERAALPADPITVAQYIRYLIDRPTRNVVERYERDGQTVTRSRREGPATPATVSRHSSRSARRTSFAGFPIRRSIPTSRTSGRACASSVASSRAIKKRGRQA